jgi:ketosteroid isomerase-like protein
MDDRSTLPTTSRTPLDTVGAVYTAFGRGDLPGVFALLHPAVDWSVTVTAPGGELVPMLHNGVGHEAAERYFGGVAQLEMHVFEVGRTVTDGDVVIAEVHFEATHRVTGKRAVIDELHHWVVRDGLVVRYRPYVDTAALIELFRP